MKNLISTSMMRVKAGQARGGPVKNSAAKMLTTSMLDGKNKLKPKFQQQQDEADKAGEELKKMEAALLEEFPEDKEEEL